LKNAGNGPGFQAAKRPRKSMYSIKLCMSAIVGTSVLDHWLQTLA